MICEVPIAGLPAHAARFPGAQLAMVTSAIRAGNTAGRLWSVGASSTDATLLLWDQGNNVFYLAGRCASTEELGALAHLIAADIRPQALAAGLAHFSLHATTPELEPVLPALFAGIQLRPVEKRFYRLRDGALPMPAAPAVDKIHFAPIARALLEDEGLQNVAEVRAEVEWMWPSRARFYAHGFGVAALVGPRLVCWCTAEYVGPAACGIGITTEDAYTNRGIATAVTARFIAESRRRGLVPYWECAAGNIPSVRVAEKAGFELVELHTVWRGSFIA